MHSAASRLQLASHVPWSSACGGPATFHGLPPVVGQPCSTISHLRWASHVPRSPACGGPATFRGLPPALPQNGCWGRVARHTGQAAAEASVPFGRFFCFLNVIPFLFIYFRGRVTVLLAHSPNARCSQEGPRLQPVVWVAGTQGRSCPLLPAGVCVGRKLE